MGRVENNSYAGNHPKERIQHSEHGESLKSRTCKVVGNNDAGTHYRHVLITE
jgi:hypothetical protein